MSKNTSKAPFRIKVVVKADSARFSVVTEKILHKARLKVTEGNILEAEENDITSHRCCYRRHKMEILMAKDTRQGSHINTLSGKLYNN